MNREQINKLFKEIYPDASFQEKLTACGFAQTMAEMARKEALEEAAIYIYPKNPEDDWTDIARAMSWASASIRSLLDHETTQPD